jgi:hypothetical protein
MENKAIKEILSLDLKNIINVEALPLKPKSILLKAVSSGNTGLIDTSGRVIGTDSYWKVVKVGDEVKLAKPEDIILDFNSQGANYLSKGKDSYIVINDYNLEIWTDPSNYQH